MLVQFGINLIKKKFSDSQIELSATASSSFRCPRNFFSSSYAKLDSM